MSLRLTRSDVAALEASLRAALTPVADPEHDWQAAVVATAGALLGADKTMLVIPQDAAVPFVSAGYEQQMLDEYAAYYRAMDEGITIIHRDQLCVYNQARMAGPGQRLLRGHPIYHDLFLPYRLRDSMGLAFMPDPTTAHDPQSMAQMLFHSERPDNPRFGDRGLDLMRLLLPAFRAGTLAHLQYHRARGAFFALMDAMPTAAVLVALGGREVHRNVAYGQLLAVEAEPDALTAASRRTAAEALRSLRPADHTTRPPRPALEIETARARYRVTATVVEARSAGVSTPVALVLLEALTVPPPTAAEVQRRYALTPREATVALLLGRGLASKDIARELGISTHTARRHTERVLAKLGVRSRAAVAAVLLRQ